MEPPGPAHSGAETAAGWSWPAVARPAAGAERLSLDFAHGCPLEGSAGTLSFLSDLSPAFSTRGAFRRDARRPGSLGLGSGSQREAQSTRSFYRREFRPGQKRGLQVGKTKRGKGTKIMAVADGSGLPIALCTACASPHEVTLVKATLAESLTSAWPERLIGDAAYESDTLDHELAPLGVALIAPHRRNRKHPTQDGRVLRRYRRRWKIGVSRKGHIVQSVRDRPRLKDSGLVAGEAPWRESKTAEPSDNMLGKEYAQSTRLQRAVNVEVASLHGFPVAETVDNVRKQQELAETSPRRQFSPAGYQRRHGAKDDVETGEALDARRRKLAEEMSTITSNGKCGPRRQGGGSGRSTVEGRAAKRVRREGPGPVSTPFVKVRQG